MIARDIEQEKPGARATEKMKKEEERKMIMKTREMMVNR